MDILGCLFSGTSISQRPPIGCDASSVASSTGIVYSFFVKTTFENGLERSSRSVFPLTQAQGFTEPTNCRHLLDVASFRLWIFSRSPNLVKVVPTLCSNKALAGYLGLLLHKNGTLITLRGGIETRTRKIGLRIRHFANYNYTTS